MTVDCEPSDREQALWRADIGPTGVHLLPNLMPYLPVVVLSRRWDVLNWNPLARSLLMWGRAADGEVNLARLIVQDPASRTLLVHWRRHAVQAVAELRRVIADDLRDADTIALIKGLNACTAEWGRIWSDPPARRQHDCRIRLLHPYAGPMELTHTVLESPHGSEEHALVFSAPEGSSARAALDLLLVSRA
jgi:hypothetical protein